MHDWTYTAAHVSSAILPNISDSVAGSALMLLRKHQDMSLVNVTEMTNGLTVEDVRAIEAGEPPSRDALIQYAKVFGCANAHELVVQAANFLLNYESNAAIVLGEKEHNRAEDKGGHAQALFKDKQLLTLPSMFDIAYELAANKYPGNNDGNQTLIAKALGMSRVTLYKHKGETPMTLKDDNIKALALDLGMDEQCRNPHAFLIDLYIQKGLAQAPASGVTLH